MTITFACPCGKLLKSRTENAGRRTKCPRCDSYLVIPHISVSHDVMSASGSEPELLSHSDFSDVEYAVKVATEQASAAPPSPSLLELDRGEQPTRPLNDATPPNGVPEPKTPLPVAEEAEDAIEGPVPVALPAVETPNATVNSAAVMPAAPALAPFPSRPPGAPEPWFFAVLEWVAYLCMGLGALQFAVVVFAIALGSELDTVRTFALALVLLIVTLGFGGLALVGLDIARSLRRAARSFSDRDVP